MEQKKIEKKQETITRAKTRREEYQEKTEERRGKGEREREQIASCLDEGKYTLNSP